MAKLIFDIKETSKITGKKHITITGNTYTIDEPKDNAELIHEAEAWAFKQVKFFAGITNLQFEGFEADYKKDDSVIFVDDFESYAAEKYADDPDYQGEEGLMQLFQDLSQEYTVYDFAGGVEVMVKNDY